MSRLTIDQISSIGIRVGIAVAIIPAAFTLFVVTSRTLLINLAENAALKVLSAGTVNETIYGLSLKDIPTLWKISTISLAVGGAIIALSLIAPLVNRVYLRMVAGSRQAT